VSFDASGAAWSNLSHRRNPDEILHRFVLPNHFDRRRANDPALASPCRRLPALARARTIEYERFTPPSTIVASSGVYWVAHTEPGERK
jgi:hypothetical protein